MPRTSPFPHQHSKPWSSPRQVFAHLYGRVRLDHGGNAGILECAFSQMCLCSTAVGCRENQLLVFHADILLPHRGSRSNMERGGDYSFNKSMRNDMSILVLPRFCRRGKSGRLTASSSWILEQAMGIELQILSLNTERHCLRSQVNWRPSCAF